MNCPNSKCKKTSLDVSRTFGSSDKVERDRRCPKCGTYFKTVEYFVSYIEQCRSKHLSEIDSSESVVRDLQFNLNQVKSAFEVFMGLLDVKKKR